jgi:RimK family alpha-L-glutamate ligase
MKILIAGLVKNIQAERLEEEGRKRGHEVEGCYAKNLILSFEKGSFSAKLKDGRNLRDYDLIYLMVSKTRWEWYTACSYLNKNFKTKVVNFKTIDPNYNYFLTPATDYLKQVEEGLPFPKSKILLSKKDLKEEIKDFKFPFIIKASRGRKGKGVYLIHSLEEAKVAAEEILGGEGVSFVVREFIPNNGDIRIFVVGGKAIGAMKRTSQKGEFRSNISLGGEGDKFDLESYPEIAEIAEKAAEITRTEIAGVDIIINKETNKPYILEINPSPQFEGLEKYTKVNAAEEIIKYFEKC